MAATFFWMTSTVPQGLQETMGDLILNVQREAVRSQKTEIALRRWKSGELDSSILEDVGMTEDFARAFHEPWPVCRLEEVESTDSGVKRENRTKPTAAKVATMMVGADPEIHFLPTESNTDIVITSSFPGLGILAHIIGYEKFAMLPFRYWGFSLTAREVVQWEKTILQALHVDIDRQAYCQITAPGLTGASLRDADYDEIMRALPRAMCRALDAGLGLVSACFGAP